MLPGLAGLLSVLVLSASVQAAPITYRLESSFHVEMQSQAGGSGGLIGANGPLITGSQVFSAVFTYDSAVVTTPIDLPPNTADVTYLQAFLAPGAFTFLDVRIGDRQLATDNLTSSGISYLMPQFVPADTIYHRVGAVAELADDEPGLMATFGAHNFTLTYVSVTFEGGSSGGGGLPEFLTSSDPQGHLQFTGDDGSTVSAYYMFGTLTQVPVPGAFWLFGSGLLAPIAMRLRRRK